MGGLWLALNTKYPHGIYGHTLIMILVFFFTLIIVLITIFAYAKHSVKKSRETGSRDSIEKKFMKEEKERQYARRIEETGYSERDEKEYEDEYSDDSKDEE